MGLRTVGALNLSSTAAAVGGLASTLASSAEAAEALDHSTALVIGTGYGGAVTALRLANKGISVTMLEMGQLWDTPGSDGKVFCGLFKPDERAMWFKKETTAVVSTFLGFPTNFSTPSSAGVLDVISHPGIDVYCGRGVGGSSLVNLAMTITPLREVMEKVMPSGVDLDALYNRHFPTARAQLKVNDIRPAYFEKSKYHRYARVARDALAKADLKTTLLPSAYDYAYMEKEEAGLVPKSAYNFEASFGNNYGKGSVDKNYLADAVATGRVTIRPLHIVKSISQGKDGGYLVNFEQIDKAGNVLKRGTMGCKYLFMAGGSMGTTDMLVRARETGTLPALNAHVGTDWSSNGDIFTARTSWRPMGGKVSMVPASGFYTRDQNNAPLFSMNLPMPFLWLESWVSMNIVMPATPSLAKFTYDSKADKTVLLWDAQNAAAPMASTKYIFDKINRANKSIYRADMFDGKDCAINSTYHPVGGVPLGKATDLFGRVKGYDRLYVVDGALIPGGLSANPALTITALAERNIENILARDMVGA